MSRDESKALLDLERGQSPEPFYKPTDTEILTYDTQANQPEPGRASAELIRRDFGNRLKQGPGNATKNLI